MQKGYIFRSGILAIFSSVLVMIAAVSADPWGLIVPSNLPSETSVSDRSTITSLDPGEVMLHGNDLDYAVPRGSVSIDGRFNSLNIDNMPIVLPDSTIDYKILVSVPDPSVDYKILPSDPSIPRIMRMRPEDLFGDDDLPGK